MKIVWKTAAVASLLLASCGGDSNAALSKNFNYGAAQAPTTAEQSAATSAQGTVSSTSTFGSSPNASTASSIISIADDLSASAFGSSALGAAGLPQAEPHLRRALSTYVTDACATVTTTKVTFTNCSDSDSGYTFTLNGSVEVINGNEIKWDINGAFSGTNQGVSINLALHQGGNLKVTSTTVSGNSTSEIRGNVSAQGQSASFGLDTAAIVDLTYNSTCVTAGTIEVKRVWSEKPNGASGPDFADLAVKLSWTGCNTVQVQHSM
jgi:hypothetical protein